MVVLSSALRDVANRRLDAEVPWEVPGSAALDDFLADRRTSREVEDVGELLALFMKICDAVNVARAFSERLKLDGLVLTKLDGTAKGGVIFAIAASVVFVNWGYRFAPIIFLFFAASVQSGSVSR